MNAGDVWFQRVSVGLTGWGTRDWTFSSLLLVRAQGKKGGTSVILAQLWRRNVIIGSPWRLTGVGAKCAQFAVAASLDIATYTMYYRCLSPSLSLSLGWMKQLWLLPSSVWAGGERKSSSMIGWHAGWYIVELLWPLCCESYHQEPLTAEIYIRISARWI